MIYHRGRLVISWSILLDYLFKVERSIFQLGPSQVCKVGINLSSVVQTLALEFVLHFMKISIQRDSDFRIVENILNKQCLMLIREVPSIKVIPYWDM
jgi:hypothetical protein